MTTTLTEKKDIVESTCAGPDDCACTVTPAVDILESEKQLTIQLDMPGVTQDKIDVQYEQGALQATGLREGSGDRGALRYERSFRLGDSIDATGITADFKQGVLSITLPKCESARQRKIEVTAD